MIIMRNFRFNYGLAEHRLIHHFGEAPKPHPLVKSIDTSIIKIAAIMTEAKGEKDTIDEKRVAQDIDDLKRDLLILGNEKVKDEALGKLKEELGKIVQEFQMNEQYKTQQLKTLETKVYERLQPIMQKLRSGTLEGVEGISDIKTEQDSVTFKFGEETIKTDVSGASNVSVLRFDKSGIVLRLSDPMPMLSLEKILPNFQKAVALIPIDLRKDVKDITQVNLETFELALTKDGKESKYILTPNDFLQVGSKEDWDKELQNKINGLNKKRDGLIAEMKEQTGGQDVRKNALRERKGSLTKELKLDFVPEKEVVEGLITTGKITEKQAALIREYHELDRLSRKAYIILKQIGEVEEDIEKQEDRRKNSQKLSGVDAKGEPISVVVESRGGHDGVRREYYDKSGRMIRERIYQNGSFNSVTYEQFSDEINYALDGSKVKTTYRQGTDKKTDENIFDTEENLERETRFKDDGSIDYVEQKKLGVREIYEKGVKIRTEISSSIYAFGSAKEVVKLKDGEKLLLDEAKKTPEAALRRIKELNETGITFANRILEEAVRNAAEKDLRDVQKNEWQQKQFASVEQKDYILGLCKTGVEKYTLGKLLIRSPYVSDSPEKIKEFWEDPALEGMLQVKAEWIKKDHPLMKEVIQSGGEELAMAQMRAMIARNLFFRKVPITELTAKEEFGRVVEARERYKDMNLFKDRNVLLAAHEENLKDMPGKGAETKKWFEVESGDSHVFAKKALQEAMKKQVGAKGDLQVVRPESEGTKPEEHMKRLREAKADILNKIKNTPPPFTFVFDGHGGPDSLFLSHGQIEGFRPGQGAEQAKVIEMRNTIKISAEELAAALKMRQEKFAEQYAASPQNKDVLVLACCFNANFIRNVYDKMGTATKPIAVGQSEYGQYSLFFLPHKYGSPFLSKVVGIATEDKPPTIGTIFENEFMDLHNIKGSSGAEFEGNTNPSIYIPDEKNQPMQITKNENTNQIDARNSLT